MKKRDHRTPPPRTEARRKLSLHRETLRYLAEGQIREVAGGRTRNTCGVACTAIDCV
jgi:hypothetical protein